ncbi:F-box protein [Carex littledalei]|uniref:F-box protein n=1 Tax=Carex littledalei TaxID=544730 RepID=A0A833V2R9_9POAL|nr:F-box protein [Carex littledalei]
MPRTHSDQPTRPESMVTCITTLPRDLIWEIVKHILADDVVHYIRFRATCSALRSSLPGPCDLAFSFLPRNWIRDYINDKRNAIINNPHMETSRCLFMIQIQAKDRKTHIPFMHLPTGRHVELVLPVLETHFILSITDGLLILVHEQTRAMRLFNPLTHCMSADFPPTLLEIRKMSCYAITAVAPSRSIVEQPILMIALEYDNVAYFAKAGDQTTLQIQLPFCITSALFFKDGFYCTDNEGSIWEIKPDQKSVKCVFYHDIDGRSWHLVQSRTGMLLIDYCPRSAGTCNDAFRKLNVFKFDLNANTIIPTNDIGDCTIFVGLKQRALLNF